jgi:probable rRNA maturation factor
MTETGRRGPRRRPVAVEIVVEAGAWAHPRALRKIAEPAIAAAVRRSKKKILPSSEVAIVFSDDAHVRKLNRRFRGKNKPTNVLSFPAATPTALFGPLLGDIVLSHETVKAEAEDQGIEFVDHATHLIVHGFLHLLGYDHGNDSEALVMERLETAILRALGVADPYGDSDDA